jgi:hypothetical protein
MLCIISESNLRAWGLPILICRVSVPPRQRHVPWPSSVSDCRHSETQYARPPLDQFTDSEIHGQGPAYYNDDIQNSGSAGGPETWAARSETLSHSLPGRLVARAGRPGPGGVRAESES